jgi:hypothetical protein
METEGSLPCSQQPASVALVNVFQFFYGEELLALGPTPKLSKVKSESERARRPNLWTVQQPGAPSPHRTPITNSGAWRNKAMLSLSIEPWSWDQCVARWSLIRRIVAVYQYFLSFRKLECNMSAGRVIHKCFHNLQGFPPIITSIDYTHYVTLSPLPCVSPNACSKCFVQPIKTTLYGSALSTSPPPSRQT